MASTQQSFKISFSAEGGGRAVRPGSAPAGGAAAGAGAGAGGGAPRPDGEPRKRRRNRNKAKPAGGAGAAASGADAMHDASDSSVTPPPPAGKKVIVSSRPATAAGHPAPKAMPAPRHAEARPHTAGGHSGHGGHHASAGAAAGAGAHHEHHAHPAPAHHGHEHGHGAAAAGGSASVSHPGGTSGIDERFLSTMRWTDAEVAGRLSAPTRRALAEVFKFERLSKVQAATLPALLSGKDVFAKAKTGAGKTLSFLIPALEVLLKSGAAGGRGGHRVGILVISPTRELAQQIMSEAQNLLRFHSGLTAMTVIGGTNINGERQRMSHGGRIGVDILVATPGRCVDHIESTPGFVDALGATKVLVLDEADRLLDMGFKPALDKIIGALPPAAGAGPGVGYGRGAAGGGPSAVPRQTMLFSATVPEEVKTVAHRCMRPGYDMVDTVGAEEPSTNAQVYQEVLVVPAPSVIPALARTLAHIARSDPSHKVIVFFTTARLTGYMAGIFEKMPVPGARAGGRFNIVEMHSRKSQGYRTSAAERFRTAKGIFMFSSDVSARGMDYPDISHVVQVGLTDKESYIHRVGRTARAGKSGSGIIILADYEAPCLLPDLRGIPLHPAGPASPLTGGSANGVPGAPGGGVSGPVAPPAELASLLAGVPADKELRKESLQCYSATLGYYNSHLRKLRWDKARLASEINSLMLTLGLPEIPMMSRETLGKMGLRGTPGLKEAPKGWRPGDGEDI